MCFLLNEQTDWYYFQTVNLEIFFQIIELTVEIFLCYISQANKHRGVVVSYAQCFVDHCNLDTPQLLFIALVRNYKEPLVQILNFIE